MVGGKVLSHMHLEGRTCLTDREIWLKGLKAIHKKRQTGLDPMGDGSGEPLKGK